MLFNSYEFIFIFFPFTFILYFLFNKFFTHFAAKLWLAIASLAFYTWWDPKNIFVITVSILFNYTIGKTLLLSVKQKNATILLIFGCSTNLVFLGYYKYANFLITNINTAFDQNFQLLEHSLPLAISFFTFQQIAFLVDCYRNEIEKFNMLQYFLFVSLFCQLIAGPIVNHKEMFPQFEDPQKKIINFQNISNGLFIFFCGLVKKVVLADSLSNIVNIGFDQLQRLSFVDAWTVSFSYTMQLYFDFSGYVDMAMGTALMLNLSLPSNFESPYRSLNISEFWRKWHITLGRFLKQYLYIPLGGNRKSKKRTLVNILITFILGGIWHGAGWLFLIWGLLHGLAMVVHRIWTKFEVKISPFLAGLITFLFINITWIIFRANNMESALKLLKGMFVPDVNKISILLSMNPSEFYTDLILLAVCFFYCFSFTKHYRAAKKFQTSFNFSFFYNHRLYNLLYTYGKSITVLVLAILIGRVYVAFL